MKSPLPPSLISALADVADIADRLAMNACEVTAVRLADMSVSAVLDNLDHVASCLTLAELDHAPAMLMSAARAFRQTFPFASLGWEDAGRLQKIACMIDDARIAAAAARATA